MRHEWKPRGSDTLRRVSDEDSVLPGPPGHFIQDLDGNWRPVYVSGEVCAELLLLAARVKELEAKLLRAVMRHKSNN